MYTVSIVSLMAFTHQVSGQLVSPAEVIAVERVVCAMERPNSQQTGFKGNLRLLVKPLEQPHLPFKILSAALSLHIHQHRFSATRLRLGDLTPSSMNRFLYF